MDPRTGQCTSEEYSYSGSLAPLSEEMQLTKADTEMRKLSLHFRGPTWLKQLAVYYPDAASHAERSFAVDNIHGHRHGHQRLHHSKIDHVAPGHVAVERAVGDMVTAIVDGQEVHWINQYAGPAASSSITAGQPASVIASACPYCSIQTTISTTVDAASQSSANSIAASSATASASVQSANPLPVSGGSKGGSGSWSRQAYYNADAGDSEGFTFLNHFGGTLGKPGTADGGPAFGASLSYASSDGKSAATSPQTLQNKMIEDDVEVIVMSNRSCEGDSCGYIRPGGVAYHGFAGDHKLFMMEFSMPATGKTGFNGDMPGIWLLNAQIPLTSQYGTNSECSCWTSGCGEFDLFEVLDTGNFRCKSTLHMAPAGGSSDYFQRPEKNTIKAAVLLQGNDESARIQILDNSQGFDESLSRDLIQAMTQDDGKGTMSTTPSTTTAVLAPSDTSPASFTPPADGRDVEPRLNVMTMATVSPPKPWERGGASGSSFSSPSPTTTANSSQNNTSSTATSSTSASQPPALPEKPSSLNSVVNRTASNYSPYGANRLGNSPYGVGGYGSYSSPYSRFGGMNSMYGGGYGSGYGGMYGGMGGMGGMYGGGMGQPGMMGMDPNDPNSLTNSFNQNTQATFQMIESIVGAFGGFAQMLESTYMATHSSFFGG
ncbi:MAG: hypothetical protein Q9216_002901 [Gyalolechia sp. 2 TL-2023]